MNKRILKQAGFSLLEVMMAAGMTAALALGASTVMLNTVKSEKKTSVQGLIDREFAAASHLAGNAPRLAPYVRPGDLGSCLTKNSGGSCTSHGTTKPYPAPTGPRDPLFNTTFSLLGQTNCSGPTCVVQRTMRFRWICSARSCSGLETEISVIPLGEAARNSQARTTTITLDARQFTDRNQFSWNCDSGGRTITSLDYNDLSDGCVTYSVANCSTPRASYQTAGPGDCQAPTAGNCGTGFNRLNLDSSRISCGPGGDFQ